MPRLIVPSIGGGIKLIRTLLAGTTEGACSGTGEGATDSYGESEGEGDSSDITEEVGAGDSWGTATWIKTTQTTKVIIRNSSIVMPIHVRKKIVAPFAIAQKFFIDLIRDKLIV